MKNIKIQEIIDDTFDLNEDVKNRETFFIDILYNELIYRDISKEVACYITKKIIKKLV